MLELLAKVTELVVPGCVVIPANSTETVPGELAAEGAERGAPLHVTVTPGEVRERVVTEVRDWLDVVNILIVVVAAFALWLIGTAVLIWGERRVVSWMQSRIGPNRLGPLGILQTIADGAKLFFKEDIAPRAIDKLVYIAAPVISATVALVTFAVIPFGGEITVGDRTITLQVWDPPVGILWVLAMGSIGVYGIVLAGWSSGSKYPLLGAVRSSAQMVSYELAMGLGVAAVAIYAGSLRTSEIVVNQAGSLANIDIPVLGEILGVIPPWHIIPMAPAFLLFFLGAIAETQRPPSTCPKPRASWSRASTPSTAARSSRCSTWPSS